MQAPSICTLVALLVLCAPSPGQERADRSLDWDFAHPEMWSANNGSLHTRVTKGTDTQALSRSKPAADWLLETQVRLAEGSPRQNFGFVLRAADDRRLVLRYYDGPQALELLAFQGSKWQRVGRQSSPTRVSTGVWYSMKAAALGPLVMAKLWPSTEAEPDWQFRVRVDTVEAGRAGLVVHDAGQFEFRKIKFSAEAEELRVMQKQVEAARVAALERLRAALRLAVVPRTFPEADGKTRIVEVVPYALTDRYPQPGTLTWKQDGKTRTRRVGLGDYQQGALLLRIPEPTVDLAVEVTFTFAGGPALRGIGTIAPATMRPWRHYVERSIETLITHGRDDYGPLQTPLIMAVLDTATLRSPSRPARLDAIVRLEGRIHRRGERGSNLWYDQGLILAMRRLSKITGKPRYGEAADAYTTHFLASCNKPENDQHGYHTGLPSWGTHIYWDCFKECPAGDQNGSGPHEILVFRANWADMYRLAPQAVRRIAERVWTHHVVNKSTGLHNRHDDGRQGCDFAFSGGSFLHLFAVMARLTGESHYLDKAKTVADWHWKNRDQSTDLPADCPGLTGRYDGKHTFTTVAGPHAMLLLEAYRASGDPYFRKIASRYILAYDRFAWDAEAQSYYAMLKLDGTPLPDQAKGSGYGAYAPYGHVNVWRTTFYSYEFTLSAAQAAVQAYGLSGRSRADRDPRLLRVAKRWGRVVERAMPAHTGRRWKQELEQHMPLAATRGGAYAEDYGRGISLFVHLYRATGDQRYLGLARSLAKDAVKKLFHNGLFKGHAGKPYYEATNGVGLLLYALLELDSPEESLRGAF